MPVYRYRAMTENGSIVTNTMEETSKYGVIQKLKRNNLTPINVAKSLQRVKSKRTVKKNARGVEDIMKNVDTTNLLRKNTKTSKFDILYHNITMTEKVTSRDIIVFTQNFYLLKKANFNNIHALSTIIDSTENFTFRGVLEDILAGVEARRKYVFYNGILWRYIPLFIYKYDKGWRIIWKLNKFARAGC